MTEKEEPFIKVPKSHPYLAKLTMDPADLYEFERRFEDRPEIKVRMVDSSEPDIWVVYVACASREVVEKLEANW